MSRTLEIVGSLLIIIQLAVARLDKRQCLEVVQPECSNFFTGGASQFWPSLFPSARNLTLEQSLEEFDDFSNQISKSSGYCSHLLHSFLCLHYFPTCNRNWSSPEPQRLVVPCRKLCELAIDGCLQPALQEWNISLPGHLNCKNFPENTEEYRSDGIVIACPTSAVHLEFGLGKRNKLGIHEGDGYIDICIRLATTGTHSSLQCPVTVNLTSHDITAKGGVDYNFNNCTELVFPVGAVIDDVKCCRVEIIDDCLIEKKEEFYIHADISFSNETASGSGNDTGNGSRSGIYFAKQRLLLFGSALNSSSGSIVVCIHDNDYTQFHLDNRHCLAHAVQPVCSNFFTGGASLTWPSLFPNSRHLTYEYSMEEFGHFASLLVSESCGYCSYLLHSFLCLHYFPSCDPDWSSPEPQPLVVPCRSLCQLAIDGCLKPALLEHNISFPEHLNCINFPEKCYDEGKGDSIVVTACPIPAVHLEFAHERKLKTQEGNGSLIISVHLASTGTHSSLPSSVTVDLTSQDVTAKVGLDYNFKNCTELVFPTGAVKGHLQQCTVQIVDDGLAEGKEEFSVHADIRNREIESGSGNSSELLFGCDFNSTRGSIGVSIHDNDVCLINQKRCSENRCKQRKNANSRTLTNNNYTYVAHVELLGIKNFSDCTAVNVRIIKCCNLSSRNHCPEKNRRLTVPTCPGCPAWSTLNNNKNEYLIAGIRQNFQGTRSIILPDSKDVGIFSSWDSKHENIADWTNC